jgi:hypothetical protein
MLVILATTRDKNDSVAQPLITEFLFRKSRAVLLELVPKHHLALGLVTYTTHSVGAGRQNLAQN